MQRQPSALVHCAAHSRWQYENVLFCWQTINYDLAMRGLKLTWNKSKLHKSYEIVMEKMPNLSGEEQTDIRSKNLLKIVTKHA